jgi:hypothetical protein
MALRTASPADVDQGLAFRSQPLQFVAGRDADAWDDAAIGLDLDFLDRGSDNAFSALKLPDLMVSAIRTLVSARSSVEGPVGAW